MIKKFLYQMNENNKRIITGLVEDDNILDFDPNYQYDMVLEDKYTLSSDERKISNFGKQYYAVAYGDIMRYLNVNDYMLKVKVDMTENPAFASTMSKDMMMAILENTNYFNSEIEIEYVDSGLFLCQDKGFKDYFDGWFRNVDDDVYVMLLNMKKPLYVGKKNNQYVLVDDFKDAFRVSKKECRNLIIANGYVDTTMKKKDVAFSHYNCFESNGTYGFGGLNSFSLSYNEGTLSIKRDFTPTCSFKLINDEKRQGILRDVCYAMKKGVSGTKAVLKVNSRYVKDLGNGDYFLTDNATDASMIDTRDIEILKMALKMFLGLPQYETLNGINYYLYYNDGVFKISDEKLDGQSSICSSSNYFKYKEALLDEDKFYIAKCDNKYLEYEALDDMSFKATFSDNCLNVTPLSNLMIKALGSLLNKKFATLEYKPIPSYNEIHNIEFCDKGLSPIDAYLSFVDESSKSNIRLNPYLDIKTIKTESDKGALEYLTRFYLKAALDTKALFEMVLKKENIKNVLLVAPTNGADLVGISSCLDTIDKELNVDVLESVKWGYHPKTYLSKKLNINAAYRLPIQALNLEQLKKYDMIYISRSFKDDGNLITILTALKGLDKKTLVALTGLNDMYSKDEYTRLKLTKKSIKTPQIDANTYNSILDNDTTHISLLRVGNQKAIDLLKK